MFSVKFFGGKLMSNSGKIFPFNFAFGVEWGKPICINYLNLILFNQRASALVKLFPSLSEEVDIVRRPSSNLNKKDDIKGFFSVRLTKLSGT